MTHAARRAGLGVRAVAVAVAVAVCALLVGLSAAHSALPADTFQANPRVPSGIVAPVSTVGDPYAKPGQTAAHQFCDSGLPAALPREVALAFYLSAAGGRAADNRHRLRSTASGIDCRGPPETPLA